MNEDEQYLAAAHKLRADSELPEALAPKLDQLIAAVEDADGDARADSVDDLVFALRQDAWARERLTELVPDDERGALESLFAGDGMLAGEDADTSDLLEFTCTACRYVNKLAYRPVDEDLPLCQNPDVDPHALVLD